CPAPALAAPARRTAPAPGRPRRARRSTALPCRRGSAPRRGRRGCPETSAAGEGLAPPGGCPLLLLHFFTRGVVTSGEAPAPVLVRRPPQPAPPHPARSRIA